MITWIPFLPNKLIKFESSEYEHLPNLLILSAITAYILYLSVISLILLMPGQFKLAPLQVSLITSTVS